MLKAALGLRYGISTGQFQFQPAGMVHPVTITNNALITLVATTLPQQSSIFNGAEITLPHLKRIVNTLRALCVDAGDDNLHRAEQFVQANLVTKPGWDITSAEVWAAYSAWIFRLGCPALSKYEFHRHLPGFIKARFGICKMHEVPRPRVMDGRLTQRNGWRGIGLADTADTADGKSYLATQTTQNSK